MEFREPKTILFKLSDDSIYEFSNYCGFSELLENLEVGTGDIVPIAEKFTYEQFDNAHHLYLEYVKYKKAENELVNNIRSFTKQDIKLLMNFNLNNDVLRYLIVNESPVEIIIRNNETIGENELIYDSVILYLMYGTTRGLKFMKACQNGHINVVKWFYTQGINIHMADNQCIMEVVKNGNLELLKWFFSVIVVENLELIKFKVFDEALINNKLEIAKWIFETYEGNYKKRPYNVSGGEYNEIVGLELILINKRNESKREIGEWYFEIFLDERKINLFDVSKFEILCMECKKIDNIKWMISKGYDRYLERFRDILKKTCINGFLEVAKYLYELNRIEEIKDIFKETCENFNLPVAKWLFTLDLIFDREIFSDILESCVSKYGYFNQMDRKHEKDILKKQINMLEWLWSLKEEYPDLVKLDLDMKKGILYNRAYRNRNVEVFKWLYGKLKPSQKKINDYYYYLNNSKLDCDVEFKEWLETLEEVNKGCCIIC